MLSTTDQWLLHLCDPRGLLPDLPPCDLRDDELPRLFQQADRHGVLPALIANLRRNNPLACKKIQEGGAAQRLAQLAAVGLFLQVRASELLTQFSAKGVAGVLIKGPLIARRAYRPASLRTYIDIDLLVSRSAWEPARAILQNLGYRPKQVGMKYAAGYGEEEWMHPEHPGCSFELHWNLVNSPTIRQGLSVTYEDLAPLPAAAPPGDALSPAALLLIAAVHAAASHSFDKLQHLCDIAQLARGTAGEIDPAQLHQITRATGAELALVAALRLAGTTLGDDASRDLLTRLNLPAHARACSYLTPTTVLRGQDRHLPSHLRRRLFRQALKRRHA